MIQIFKTIMEEQFKIIYKIILLKFQMNGKKIHLIILKKAKMNVILNNIVNIIMNKKMK